jgi:hypothetical protein
MRQTRQRNRNTNAFFGNSRMNTNLALQPQRDLFGSIQRRGLRAEIGNHARKLRQPRDF